MYVHLLREPQPDDLEYLRSNLQKGVELTSGEIDRANPETRILIAGRPTVEILDALSNLEALIVPWTGIPPKTLDLVRERPGLALHNLHHNAAPTAELALTLLLAAAKAVVPHHQDLRKGDWSLRYQPPRTLLLEGKNALVLGYGAIGQRIARALRGLGVEVAAISRSGQAEAGADRIYNLETLPELLPQADFLILALPLTPETEGLIGERELGLLPEAAVVVNVARGEIIQQEPFYNALGEKRIAAAGLDVWYRYPADEQSRSNTFPGDFPFHELDNLVLSPHRGGLVREIERLRMAALAALINQAAAGLAMENQVDLKQGY